VHQISNVVQVSTPVKVGTTYGPVTQVLSGLKAGDKVVGTAFRMGGTGGTRSRTGTGSGGGTGGGGTGGGGTGGGGTGGGGFGGPPQGAGGANG
jgi:hypothetical protein